MLELKEICGGYGRERQLHDITFSLAPESITSIVGPNGCGKTTLLRIMAGLHEDWEGQLSFGGIPLGKIKPQGRAKLVSFLPQSRNIPSITVSSLVLHGRFPYMGYPRRYRREDRQIAGNAMKETGIGHLAARSMAELSGGERQRAYLAMILAQDTPLILLDEPATYLDISHKLEMMELMAKWKRKGKTIVMALHELDLALQFSDQVLLMDKGRMKIFAAPQKVCDSGLLDDVFGIVVKCIPERDKRHYLFDLPKEK